MTSTCGLTRPNRVEQLTRHRSFAFDTPCCVWVCACTYFSFSLKWLHRMQWTPPNPRTNTTHTQESERMKEKAHTNPSAWHERSQRLTERAFDDQPVPWQLSRMKKLRSVCVLLLTYSLVERTIASGREDEHALSQQKTSQPRTKRHFGELIYVRARK